MLFKDQLGNSLTLLQPPKRIISLVPSQTELLVHLGLKDRLVGVTKFCVHPTALRSQVAVVGGTKQVDYNKISALNPDFIIANKEENTQEMVVQLGKICPVWVSDVNTLDDNYSLIEQVGLMCDVQKKADELLVQIKAKAQAFSIRMEKVTHETALYLIWNEPLMGAGSPSFINAMLQLNKFANMLGGQESRYPEISATLIELPNHILLSSEPFPFKEKHKKQLAKQTNATLTFVDGEYFSWYGSRLLKAFDYFTKLQVSLGRIN